MANLAGRCSVDGLDLWTQFQIVYMEGDDDLLKYPEAKPRISHDWSDKNGLQQDTSLVTFKERQISLRFAFWVRDGMMSSFVKVYEDFLALMAREGMRRFEFASLGFRSFYMIYKSCTSFKKATKTEGLAIVPGGIFMDFTIQFTELEPQVKTETKFIVTEQGHFLVT